MDKVSIKAINRSIILSIIFVIVFILAMVGITYAFFSIVITGNETASSITVDTVDLGTVTFIDGDEINAEGIYPMELEERISKTFTIRSNDNEADVDYTIYLTVTENTFIQNYSNEFTYTLNGSSNAGGTTTTGVNAEVPAARVAPYQIGTGLLKTGGDVHTYTFTIGLNEMGSNQNYNQGQDFRGKLSVETKKYTHDRSIWGE